MIGFLVMYDADRIGWSFDFKTLKVINSERIRDLSVKKL